MKRTTKNDLIYCIRDGLTNFWTSLLDVVDPECSFDDLPRHWESVYDVEAFVERKVIDLFDNNGFIVDGDYYKATSFYSGGGIWLSAKYLNDTTYAVVSNEDPLCISYYDNRDEDKDTQFPCQNMTRSVAIEEMTSEDRECWEELAIELHRNAH